MHPVVIVDAEPVRVDLTQGYDPDHVLSLRWGIGGYLEQRTSGMYRSGIFGGVRNLHVGVDVWGPAGTPVYAFAHGRIWGMADNRSDLDYGPTIITEHRLDGRRVWALYGHLSRRSLEHSEEGASVSPGDVIGWFGDEAENGGWVPHVHFQLSLEEPERPDLPGVVEPDLREEAAVRFPDPEAIIRPFYRIA